MDVIENYGREVQRLCAKRPVQAQRLLRLGWQTQDIKFKYMPDRRLTPADRFLAKTMMDHMLLPLKDPGSSAIVSVFTPCELLQETGLHPYNVESFSCYLAASKAERGCLQAAEDGGISETLCSYHKTFLGAAEGGLLPRPKCIVYTSLACDANLLTFRKLEQFYEVPCYFIDVPMKQTAESVACVEEELRGLADFLEKQTGRQIDEERLKERVARSRRTAEKYRDAQLARSDRYIPTDLVSPLYCGMANNILLGTREQERYAELMLEDVREAAPAKGARIYWMHTIPFWSKAVRDCLYFKESAQIVGCELADCSLTEMDPEKPYEAMARRLVYNSLNGTASRRIEAGIRHAKERNADGAVWFCHWGCKHTLGGAQLAKKEFEKQGIPLLILDGDGCDRSHGGEGQTATRLGAFLEMLGGAVCG